MRKKMLKEQEYVMESQLTNAHDVLPVPELYYAAMMSSFLHITRRLVVLALCHLCSTAEGPAG